MNAAAPELVIHAIHLTGASLETTAALYNAPSQLHFRLNLTPGVLPGPVTGRHRVWLRALAEAFRSANPGEDESPVVAAEVTVAAFVELKHLSAQQTEIALNVDIPNHLVPVARHHLQQLTLNAGLPPVMLPFVTFQPGALLASKAAVSRTLQ